MLDLDRGRVWTGDGTCSQLTRIELRLLRYLVERPHCSVGRDELLREVWGASSSVVSRACDTTISRLREKIELDPKAPDHLLTVHGIGYRFLPVPAPSQPVAPSAPSTENLLHLGDRQVDLRRMRVTTGGTTVPLTPRETALIERLYRAEGAVVERAVLTREICNQRVGRALDTLLWRVRSKIEADPSQPRFLVRGQGGYRLELPPTSRPPSTPMFGRDRELARIVGALECPSVVAIVGPAGMGKTTLAREVAARTGAVWVDGGAATSLADLVRAVEVALGMVAMNGSSVERVGDALSGNTVPLVVLDELERLDVGAVELVELWRRRSPSTGFVVTSRAWFRADCVVDLGPLDPEPALALFLERASPFRIDHDPHTIAAARAVVERFDRVPLAIDLSARRLGVLSLEALRDGPALQVLADIRRSGRHGSIHDALVGAWRELDPVLQEALLTLSCFHRFTMEEADGVIAHSLSVVQQLRDRSWISSFGITDGQLVLGLLEMVRAFVEDQRRSDPGDPDRVMRYLAAMARLGDPAELDRIADWLPPSELSRLRRCAHELLRATGVAGAAGEWHLAARCADAVATFFQREGRFDDAISVVAPVLPKLPVGLDRARLLQARAVAHRSKLEVEEALENALAAQADAVTADAALTEARASCLIAHLRQDATEAERAHRAAARAGHRFQAEWACYLRECASGQPGRTTLERALAIAARAGQVGCVDRALYEMGARDAFAGAYHLAAGRFEYAARSMGRGRTALLWLRTSVKSFCCRSLLGDEGLDELGAELRAECRRAGLPTLEWEVIEGLALWWLVQARPDRARALCREILRDLTGQGWGSRLGEQGILWSTLLRAELELDRPGEALAIAASLRLGVDDSYIPQEADDRCVIEAWRALAEARVGEPELAWSRIRTIQPDLARAPAYEFIGRTITARIHLLRGDAPNAREERDVAARMAVERGFIAVKGLYRELVALDRELAKA
ncbi:MAG: winged helix-turn-helix domain-containing protein [Myxococcota bacterium]